MRKLTPVDMKPWTLPLVVIGLVLPVAAAALLLGAVGAFVAGAVMAASVIVIAARSQYEEEIEVAAADDDRYHLLVVATEAIDRPEEVEAIAAAARRGVSMAGPGERTVEILVLAPALNPGLAHWVSDLRQARLGAQERLAVSLASLAAAGFEARGKVGDTDPVQALEDELRSYPAHEVLFATPAERGGEVVEEVRRRLDRPVRRLDTSASLKRAPQAGP